MTHPNFSFNPGRQITIWYPSHIIPIFPPKGQTPDETLDASFFANVIASQIEPDYVPFQSGQQLFVGNHTFGVQILDRTLTPFKETPGDTFTFKAPLFAVGPTLQNLYSRRYRVLEVSELDKLAVLVSFTDLPADPVPDGSNDFRLAHN